MMKLFSAMSLLIFFSSCSQHTNYSPMLWKITAPQLKQPSYIFGTFHTKDPLINALPASVLSALKKSQRLYTEIPMTKKSSDDILFFSKMAHPTVLKQRLHPKTIKMLLKHLKEYKIPYTLRTLQPFKTWGIALMLSNQQEKTNYPDTLFMDEYLVATAKKNHIKQVALETPIEQLKYFDTLSLSQQEQFLVDTFAQQKDTGYADALKAWYFRGSEKGFLSLQARFASKDPKQQKLDKVLLEGLLIERNLRFTRRIHILLQNNASLRYFFAIGAGHLSGKKGILHQLEQLGYTINKIN